MPNSLPPDYVKDLRQQLGDFIRLHRQRLTPEQIGFAAEGRRRTPGLRREELAQLCRVSVTWITWLEQGREVAASAAVLARLAQALLLTAAERAYLFELAARPDPEQAQTLHSPDSVLRSVVQIGCPAYVLDSRWDIVAANEPAQQLFLHWDGAAGTPNLLRFLFTSAKARVLIDHWSSRSARLVAEFRADCGRHAEDASIRSLIEELSLASAEFQQCWQSQDVLEREGGARSFHHPERGQLDFEQLTLRPALHKNLKLVMLLPMNSDGI